MGPSPLKSDASATEEKIMRQRSVPTCSSERGFTLVELMVAASILLVGVLGTFVMLDGANRTLQENNGRIGASNLARELAEQSRNVDYDAILPTTLQGLIRPKIDPGAGGTTSGTWKVERRNIVYTVSLSVCVFDDPRDGLVTDEDVALRGAQKAQYACQTPAPVNATLDANPDDFRRVEATLSWTRDSRTRTLSQTTLIVNPSGGLGPRVEYVKPTTAPPQASALPQVSDAGATTVNFEAKTKLAATLRWYADDGYTQDLSGSGTSWTFSWPIGTIGAGAFLVDGPYTVSAQAYSGRGVPGEIAVTTVLLNRRAPRAPSNVIGGRNNRHSGIVDVRWAALRDRDIQEYQVDRVLQTTSGTTRTKICPTSPAQALSTECTDLNPPGASSGNLSYEVFAVDRHDLSQPNSTGNLRRGTPATVSIGNTGTRPPTPTGLTITNTADGRPQLSWTQPAGEEIIFYRIYRDDGPGVGGRYDRTMTADTNYSDPTPGTATTHQYWVTAVDAAMDESNDSAHVTWTRP